MKDRVKIIDVTPTVEGLMQMYIVLLESGNAEGKALAKKGMMEIAHKLHLLYVDGIGKPD